MLVAEADDSIAKVAAMTNAKIESLFLLTGVFLLFGLIISCLYSIVGCVSLVAARERPMQGRKAE